MTVQNPPIYLQAGSHPAEDVRRWQRVITTGAEGVLMSGAFLAVTEKSGTPDMSVDVAEGSALILGTEGTYQGTYFVENRGTENLVIAAADATNDRWDIVVAKVEDSDYSGATDAWSLAVVTGTPAASPADPTLPDNHIPLARVVVAALDSSIEDADVTDLRPWARLNGEVTEYTAPDTNSPAATTTLGSAVTFTDPGRSVFVEAAAGGYVDHIANYGTRNSNAYTLRVSTDGGSTWTTGETQFIDIQRTASGIYREHGYINIALGAVIPTGDIHVEMRHDMSAGAAADTQSRSWTVVAKWYPA